MLSILLFFNKQRKPRKEKFNCPQGEKNFFCAILIKLITFVFIYFSYFTKIQTITSISKKKKVSFISQYFRQLKDVRCSDVLVYQTKSFYCVWMATAVSSAALIGFPWISSEKVIPHSSQHSGSDLKIKSHVTVLVDKRRPSLR